MKKNNYSSIETIINVAKKGGMYILVDDEKRENEGDLVMSTSDTNAKNINFMAKKIFSGVQPTGNLHLGNYLGAIKNFVELLKEFNTDIYGFKTKEHFESIFDFYNG